jgi:hypothetical protein
MLHLIEVSFDQYNPSNLGGYQDVSQEILILLIIIIIIIIMSCEVFGVVPVLYPSR